MESISSWEENLKDALSSISWVTGKWIRGILGLVAMLVLAAFAQSVTHIEAGSPVEGNKPSLPAHNIPPQVTLLNDRKTGDSYRVFW